jgi:hypothetical protein
MLGLLVGMDAARRLTEELLAYDESPRDKTRKRRRGSSRRSVERSRDILDRPRLLGGLSSSRSSLPRR